MGKRGPAPYPPEKLKSHYLRVRCDAEEEYYITDVARMMGMTVSDLIRVSLHFYAECMMNRDVREFLAKHLEGLENLPDDFWTS